MNLNYVYRIDFKQNGSNYYSMFVARNKQEALDEFYASHPNGETYDIVNYHGEETVHIVLKHFLKEHAKPNEANLIASLSSVALAEVYDYIHNHHTAHIDTIARRTFSHVLEKYTK